MNLVLEDLASIQNVLMWVNKEFNIFKGLGTQRVRITELKIEWPSDCQSGNQFGNRSLSTK